MSERDVARDRAEMPSGTGFILERRSLAKSHRRLAEMLRPGLSVLDVGCGNAAITRDIAEAVGPAGLAVGADVNESLLLEALTRRKACPSLQIVRADVYAMPFGPVFDIVTAARVVQWLARPEDAVANMSAAVKSGGTLIVLDYDHLRIQWAPQPPASMRDFYTAFLSWRSTARFDNSIAARLPALFESAGVTNIEVTAQHESADRNAADFEQHAGIWAEVAATRGRQMMAEGFITERQRSTAEQEYRAWVESDAQSMTLYLNAVEGIVP